MDYRKLLSAIWFLLCAVLSIAGAYLFLREYIVPLWSIDIPVEAKVMLFIILGYYIVICILGALCAIVLARQCVAKMRS
jgi:hypothetical protein